MMFWLLLLLLRVLCCGLDGVLRLCSQTVRVLYGCCGYCEALMHRRVLPESVWKAELVTSTAAEHDD